MKLLEFAKKIITNSENNPAPFYHFIFVFLFSILVRNFLEVITYQEVKLSNIYSQLHYSTYYIALVIWLLVLVSYLTKQPAIKTAKTILTFIPVIITCPIIDFAFHSITGSHQVLGYLSPELHGSWFSNYLSFFGSHFNDRMGPTVGYRAEVALVLIGFGFYFFLKQQNILKTIASILLLYSLIYWFCTTPYLLKSILPWKYSDHLVPYYLLVSVFGLVAFFYKANKSLFLSWVKDLRLPRMLYFILLLIFGIIYSLKLGGVIYGPKIYITVLAIFSVAFAWIYSVMTNNITDLNIDKISNPKRPLANNINVNLHSYKIIAWCAFTISLVLAWAADFVVLYFIAIFIFNYFIYSMPPLRLKRLPILSKLPIAVNSFMVFLLGCILGGFQINQIPVQIVFFFLIGGTLALNFIDLKDVDGDSAAGIKTLPVLIGLKPAKLLLGLIFFTGYLLSYLFTINSNTYFFLIVIGIAQFLNFTRKNYRDWIVVVLFLISILAVIWERL